MMRDVEADFLAPPRLRQPAAGLSLLVAALVVAALLASHFASVRRDIDALETRMERAHSPEAERRSRPVVRISSADPAAEIAAAKRLVAHLTAPWSPLFLEIETATRGRIALLGIQPELGSRRVLVSAEARTLDEAIAFADRLRGGRLLRDALIGSHEVQVQDPQRPVRFTVLASWEGP